MSEPPDGHLVPRRRGRWLPRPRVAGVLVAGLLVAGMALGAVASGDGSAPALRSPVDRTAPSTSARVPSPGISSDARTVIGDEATTARDAAVRRILARRAEAVVRRDRSAWLRDIDPRATAFRARQERTFTGLRALPLARWQYRLAGPGPALAPARASALGRDAAIVRVVLAYRLAGFDLRDVEREQHLTVVRRNGRWEIAGDDDGLGSGAGTERDLWDLGEVTVVRGRHTLVVGAGGDLRRYAREGDAAVAAVSAVWTPPWSRTVVVLGPATTAQVAVLAGARDPLALDQIAAVTTGRTTGDGTTFGDRVVLNPAAYPRLAPTARRVVMAHETTHVATRQRTTAAVPIWLSEGFADYVGYRDAGVPVAVAASDLLTRVRAQGAPAALPTERDFDAARGEVGAAYNGAWLACRMLAERHGERGLVRVYAAAAANGPVGLAMALRALGTDERALLADWRRYLVEQAG